jgi:hypothetical protein
MQDLRLDALRFIISLRHDIAFNKREHKMINLASSIFLWYHLWLESISYYSQKECLDTFPIASTILKLYFRKNVITNNDENMLLQIKIFQIIIAKDYKKSCN